MNYCRKCVLPDTRPNIVIGEGSVCNACRTHESKREIDWEGREKAFRQLVDNTKARSVSLGSRPHARISADGI